MVAGGIGCVQPIQERLSWPHDKSRSIPSDHFMPPRVRNTSADHPVAPDVAPSPASGLPVESPKEKATSSPYLDDFAPGDSEFRSDAAPVRENAPQTGSASKCIPLCARG